MEPLLVVDDHVVGREVGEVTEEEDEGDTRAPKMLDVAAIGLDRGQQNTVDVLGGDRAEPGERLLLRVRRVAEEFLVNETDPGRLPVRAAGREAGDSVE